MSDFSNDELERLDRTVIWHAFSQMASYDGLIIESADGSWLQDIHGRRFLDGASSLWCNMHGHRHPAIDQAIRDQLDKVAHVTNLGMSHPVTIQLAERLTRLAPAGLEHVFFCGDGASAVEVAMKIAFQYWRQCPEPQPQRTKFIALGSAYHGDTIGTVAVGGVPRFHELFRPLLFPVLRGPCPDGLPIDKQTDSTTLCEEYLVAYRALLAENAGEVVAVIAEPLCQCAAGMVFHPPGFLRGLAELCQEFGTLLIVDEIAVGMGRTGQLFACEHEQVAPDLLCIGKGLTGGYLPMSATLTSKEIFQSFLGDASKTLYHGHTYGGNPLSAAAAMATLTLTESLLGSESMIARIHQLEIGLKKLTEYDDELRARQLGMLGCLQFRSGGPSKTASVCKRLLERGVWLRPLGDCIPIVPPINISEKDLEHLLNSLEYGLDLTVKVL